MDRNAVTILTANIAGAARMENAHPNKFPLLARAIEPYEPDVIGLQEVIQVPAAGRDDMKALQDKLQRLDGSTWTSFFFPHLDSYVQSHPKKWRSAAFVEYHDRGQQILQGTGLLVSSSCTLLSLNHSSPVSAQIMPWPGGQYAGDRDTEPRLLLTAHLEIRGVGMLLACTQLSTLTLEDQAGGVRNPKPAQPLRQRQVEWLVDQLKSQRAGGQPAVLIGDFNCEPDAPDLTLLYQNGFKHCHLGPPDDWRVRDGWTDCPSPPHTHRKRRSAADPSRNILIDHVFVTAPLICDQAYIVDLDPIEKASGLLGTISDHHPVVVRVRR